MHSAVGIVYRRDSEREGTVGYNLPSRGTETVAASLAPGWAFAPGLYSDGLDSYGLYG